LDRLRDLHAARELVDGGRYGLVTGSMIEIKIRPYSSADTSFVMDSWLKSYRLNSFDNAVVSVPPSIYFAKHRNLIASAIDRCDVLVATPSDADDTILGWACMDREVLHYVYVKERFKRWGVASRLLERLPRYVVYTHNTRDAHRLYVSGKIKHWVHDPYLFYCGG
jgi:GNAT superfamily N-acetyltransferase